MWQLLAQSGHAERRKTAVRGILIKRENALPVVLHADYGPAILLRFVMERLSEYSDLRVWKSLGWPVRIFALRVVVQHQHHQSCAVAGPGVFQHLPVSGGVAERRMRTPADREVNTLRLAGIVVIEQEFWIFGQERLAVFIVAVARSARAADHLLGWDAVDTLRVHSHEVLAAAVTM